MEGVISVGLGQSFGITRPMRLGTGVAMGGTLNPPKRFSANSPAAPLARLREGGVKHNQMSEHFHVRLRLLAY